MCGISGFISLKDNYDPNVIDLMIQSLTHRGPDSFGTWNSRKDGLALAHRRLSIIDLSNAGNQPIASKNDRYVLIYNGEIYNHLEIRSELKRSWAGHSDSETLVEAISEWGIDITLKKCVGMFAFAVWDKKDKVLFIARDRFGEKPIYYGIQKNTFMFASELKALKHHPEFESNINSSALQNFIKFSYIPSSESIYTGINKLLPGNYLAIIKNENDFQISSKVYWSAIDQAAISQKNNFQGSFQDAAERLENLLISSVNQQSISDVPIGAFLSGGIDSSLITAIYQSQSSTPINTFSIGFKEKSYNEAPFAKNVAKHLGTNHTEVILGPNEIFSTIPKLGHIYDEPFSDSSQIPTLLVSELAKKDVTVALSGDGGDEIFGGYNRYFLLKKLQLLPKNFQKILSWLIRTRSPQQWDKLYSIISLNKANLKMFGDKLHKLSELFSHDQIHDSYLRSLSTIDHTKNLFRGTHDDDISISNIWNEIGDTFNSSEKMMLIDTIRYMPDDILCKVDRASMHYSLETRVPFLDHRIFEFAWSLNIQYKLHGGGGKRILKTILNNYVPKKLFDRPKMGFGIPVGYWIKDAMYPWSYELLEPIFNDQDEFFSASYTKSIWDEHQKGTRNWGQLLWGILMYRLWLQSNNS